MSEVQSRRELLTLAVAAVATADAVNGLLAAPDRAAAMGAAARLQMDQSYRWEARLAPLAGMLGAQRQAA